MIIKKYIEFIREFVENSDNIIDSKMQELKDLVEGESEGQNMIYEWESKTDKELVVSFTIADKSAKYEYNMESLHLTKTVNDAIEFDEDIDSVEHGLEILEKDIQGMLGVNEEFLFGPGLKVGDELTCKKNCHFNSMWTTRIYKFESGKKYKISKIKGLTVEMESDMPSFYQEDDSKKSYECFDLKRDTSGSDHSPYLYLWDYFDPKNKN
jgi:hypothetical protein